MKLRYIAILNDWKPFLYCDTLTESLTREKNAMSIPATQLLEEALHLPENARADLAAKLLESLDDAVDDDNEKAWLEEIKQRLEDIQQGRVKPIPWGEARKMILDDTNDEPAS